MSGEEEAGGGEAPSASSEEIAALCQEFPEVPIIEIARHALAHGAALTRQRLIAGHASLSLSDGKETL